VIDGAEVRRCIGCELKGGENRNRRIDNVESAFLSIGVPARISLFFA